jgi:hypothetical protein
MIESFRVRGIYPDKVVSLAEESLAWPEAPEDMPPLNPNEIQLANNIFLAAASFSLDPFNIIPPKDPASGKLQQSWGSLIYVDYDAKEKSIVAKGLHEYATVNYKKLFLNKDKEIQVSGFHPVFRVSPRGQIKSVLVAQFSQHDDEKIEELGGIPFRGGTTIIAGADGRIRYVIAKPLPAKNLPKEDNDKANQRLTKQKEYLETADMADSNMIFGDDNYSLQRSKLRMKLRALHEGAVI